MDETLCACGCGASVNPGKLYVHGHNGRGKKRPAATRQKISEGVRRVWENPDYRRQLSETLKRACANPEHRALMKRIQESPEYRRKMSDSHRGKTLSPEHRMKLAVAHQAIRRRGAQHPLWKGGSRGFHQRWAREVMEAKLSRKLQPGETVHHITLNNRDHHPANLYVFANYSEHMAFHRRIKALGIEDHFRKWFSAEEQEKSKSVCSTL